ncbi:hypothetical protein TSOC_009847 [Tetrabaena socialis]|uniref:RanBD1 domain-containing protein n=1 Tax=Tetrabaena socialis TaxID=47790 RepID=A0A2J7ZUW9_9CHLO|nr:hypothetical protein TSOC_009847 [Tetrabaena socialis]|eukprot:PNH04038.1 hypothetical protein TSOC_009847 [Tetrabaena socialis]
MEASAKQRACIGTRTAAIAGLSSARTHLRSERRPGSDRAERLSCCLSGLNSQFASWVSTHKESNLHKFWIEGVRDYVVHAGKLLAEFGDILPGEGAAALEQAVAGSVPHYRSAGRQRPRGRERCMALPASTAWPHTAQPACPYLTRRSPSAAAAEANERPSASGAAPASQQVAPPTGGFGAGGGGSFGAPSAQPTAKGPAPASTFFMAPPAASSAGSAPPSTAALPFGGSAPAFGAPAAAGAPAPAAFAFGAASDSRKGPEDAQAGKLDAAAKEAPAPAASFNFGAPAAASTCAGGAGTSGAAAAPKGLFSFGAAAAAASAPAPAGGLLFGGVAPAASSASSAGAASLAGSIFGGGGGAAPAFSFGAAPDGGDAGGENGKEDAAAAAAGAPAGPFGFFGGPAPAAGAAPAFNFGGPAAGGAASTFNFGGGAAAAAANDAGGGDGDDDGEAEEQDECAKEPSLQVDDTNVDFLFKAKARMQVKSADRVWEQKGMGMMSVRKPKTEGAKPYIALFTDTGRCLYQAYFNKTMKVIVSDKQKSVAFTAAWSPDGQSPPALAPVLFQFAPGKNRVFEEVILKLQQDMAD